MDGGDSSLIGKRKAVDSKRPISFSILPENVIVHASQKQTILEALIEAEIDIDHSCGGMATCGTCRVFVDQGLETFEVRNELELEISRDRNFAKNERLACQNLVKAGLVLRKP
jgi:2Fe-2S ferredoxin